MNWLRVSSLGDSENAALVRICCGPAADVSVFSRQDVSGRLQLLLSVSMYMCAQLGRMHIVPVFLASSLLSYNIRIEV